VIVAMQQKYKLLTLTKLYFKKLPKQSV